MRKNLGSYFFPMQFRPRKENHDDDEHEFETPQQNFSWRSLLNIFKFKPKLFECLGEGYSPQQFGKDISAGITVGVLALPLAMAFAIASGATPSAGIWTAIIAGFCISLFGGSRVQIGGPTGAFIPIVYGIVAVYGYGNLLGATLLSGIILLLMGICRLGQLIRFIPIAVVLGFTNGIAVVIFLAQIKDFLGLNIENLPAEFFAKIQVLAENIHTVDFPTLTLATISLLFLVIYPLLAKRFHKLNAVPAPLVILILATLATFTFELPVSTIGTRFGGIPQSLPEMGLPNLSINNFGQMIAPAITIALLGAIESLLSARVADNQIDDQHDPNQELMGQGIANIVAPFFGGFAATGAIARTTTNVRAGGKTPIAGLVHCVILVLIVLLLAPLASFVPLATLSAIVMMTSINMGVWREMSLQKLLRFPMAYRIILIATFLVTILFDLTVAVELGMVLACFFFIYRLSKLTHIDDVSEKALAKINKTNNLAKDFADNKNIKIWEFYGVLFFGASGKIEDLLGNNFTNLPDVLILNLEKLVQIDTSGLDGLVHLNQKFIKHGKHLLLCNLHQQPRAFLRRAGFISQVGAANVCLDLEKAIDRANIILEGKN